MTDTVRTQAELMALGTEGVANSWSYQDLRDLIVSAMPIIKSADQTNSTTSYVSESELAFAVVSGHKYVARFCLFTTSDNSQWGKVFVQFTAPAGIAVSWGSDGFPHSFDQDFARLSIADEVDFYFLNQTTLLPMAIHVDALVTAGASGTVTFQFKNPAGATGSATIQAGSMLQVFKVS